MTGSRGAWVCVGAGILFGRFLAHEVLGEVWELPLVMAFALAGGALGRYLFPAPDAPPPAP